MATGSMVQTLNASDVCDKKKKVGGRYESFSPKGVPPPCPIQNNEMLSPEVGPLRDPLADGVEGLTRASPEPSALPAQRTPSDVASPEPEGPLSR